MQKSEQLLDPESSQGNIDDESSQPEYHPEAYYTSHDKAQLEQQQTTEHLSEQPVRSPKQIDVKLEDLFASSAQQTAKSFIKNYFEQQQQQSHENTGPEKSLFTNETKPNMKKTQNVPAKQNKGVSSGPANKPIHQQKNIAKPALTNKSAAKTPKSNGLRKPTNQGSTAVRESNSREEKNVTKTPPQQQTTESTLDDEMQKLQAAEEEILNSYLELDQRQKAASKRLSLIKTEFSPSRQLLSTSSSPVYADSFNKGIFSSHSVQKTNSSNSNKVARTSSLAKNYLQNSRARAQQKEQNLSSSTKEPEQIATDKGVELRDLDDKSALNANHQIKTLQTNGRDKQAKKEKKETPKPAKPLTLQDFRIAISSTSGSKSTKNSNSNLPPQESFAISPKNYQISSKPSSSSNFRWESLINSAKLREEKVFAITPSQEYLILDKEQLIDNPSVKVLNSRAFSDFLGINSTETDEEEINILKQQKPEDNMYRKNIEWLAEKKKQLQEKKEALARQSLEECTFHPTFEAKKTERLSMSQAMKASASNFHDSTIQNTRQNLRSPHTERTRSRSASKDGKGLISYSELHKHRKDVISESQNKLSLSGSYSQGFSKPKNA